MAYGLFGWMVWTWRHKKILLGITGIMIWDGLGWVGLGWVGLGWAGLGWAGEHFRLLFSINEITATIEQGERRKRLATADRENES